ncbi:MAG: hypothetical protein K2X47_05105, partial [Bdellovibrionales bacterium]|nr:hypothetical protein [Bdellovibrionales bacterium]
NTQAPLIQPPPTVATRPDRTSNTPPVIPRDRVNPPGTQARNTARPPSPRQRDARNNEVQPIHAKRVEVANKQVEVIRTHRKSREAVERMQKIFWSKQRPGIYRRFQEHRERLKYQPDWWQEWYDYGFFWGYDWNVEPQYSEIDDLFWNPVVMSYFADDWEEDVFEQWFEIRSASQLFYRTPFKYSGVIMPTDTFEDLLMSVSAMPIEDQLEFRNALQTGIGILEKQLSALFGKGFRFQQFDMTLDHFRLAENVAIVIEGMAGKGGHQYPYRALLDLQNPTKSMAIAATAEVSKQPQTVIQNLHEMNNRVFTIFGNDKP